MRWTGLVLLAALALAGEPADATAATPLRWEAGRASLATVLGRLAAGGNRVWLEEGVDDTLEAEVPAVDGVWWDGVAAVCQAFALRPDEGEPADEQLDLPGIPVPVGHGTLVLSRGQPPGMQVDGGLLACAEGGGTIRLWLRAEPRAGRGRLAWGRGEEPSLVPANPSLGLSAAEPPESAPPAATWRCSAAVPPGARLSIAVQTASLGRWTTRSPLKVGETARLQAGGQAVAAMLLVDPAVTTWEGNTLPERRPLVVLSGPVAVLQRVQVRLLQGETELGTRGGGSRSSETGTVLYRYLRAAPEGAVELELEGRSQEGMQRRQLSVPLPPPARSATGALAEASAPLAWEAGTRPLAQWLALLAASGNPVLPEVGVDTAAPVALPALRGGFWTGVLAIAEASGLAPATPTAALSCGAVRLVRRQRLASAVCGPLLIDAERVDAPPGELALRLRAALEPRLPEDGYAAPTYHWASWASDEQGRMHEIEAKDGAEKPVRIEMPEGDEPAMGGPVVVVRLAATGARRLELTGLVTLPRVRQWRGTADLAVNEPAEVLLGPRAVELSALSVPTRIGGSQWGPGLLIRGLHGAAGVRFSLTTPDGQPVENTREANRTGGGPGMRPWLGWCRIPPQGRVSAELVARAALAPLVLPVRLSVPVPDGL